jgi:hypothetical protein
MKRIVATATFIIALLVSAGGIAAGAQSGTEANAARPRTEGFRDIASVTADFYFDGAWRVESTDAFLARILPGFTALVRLTRVDADGWYQHSLALGPVVNITDTVYIGAVYGLGVDSAWAVTHEAGIDVTYETDSTATSLGVRADFFPALGYYYFLPSVSGKFHPLPPLGLFGKFFVSIDSDGVVTESFWGEADWTFSDLARARAGFTMSMASALGYSAIAGIDLSFTPAVTLRFSASYLSDVVEYLAEPQPHSGISSSVILDWRF